MSSTKAVKKFLSLYKDGLDKPLLVQMMIKKFKNVGEPKIEKLITSMIGTELRREKDLIFLA